MFPSSHLILSFWGNTLLLATFPCQTVDEIPAEFSYQRSWDEAIMPSLTEPASLLVRGIGAETFAQLTAYTSWSPHFSYQLSFNDLRTGEVKQFHVTSRIDTHERGAARFGLSFDPERDVPSPDQQKAL
jgi:hypothetical protein